MKTTKTQANLVLRIWRFYVDGFREMTVGRYLWALIIVKVVILFFVFKLFFFPNRLAEDYPTDAERAQAVRHGLINPHNSERNSLNHIYNTPQIAL